MKNKVGGFLKNLSQTINRHSPELMIFSGVLGLVAAGVMAVSKTPEAVEKLQDSMAYTDKRTGQRQVPSAAQALKEAKFKEKVAVTWRCYVPSVLLAGASVAMIAAGTSTSIRRTAAATAAYSLSETAFEQYRRKMKSLVGEEKEREARQELAQEKADAKPMPEHTVILTGRGDDLCYDLISDRVFRFDINRLQKIVNDLNRRMLYENYISLNDFYYELGLEGQNNGDELGWNIERGFIELGDTYSCTKDGRPCFVIDHRVEPRYGYDSFA